jgi:hypothetical protein
MSFKTLTDSVVSLCNDVFGDEVTYTANWGDAVIKGIFDNAWVDIEGVALLKPTLRINLVDLEADPAKGDQVNIDEVDYKVIESRKDGHGGTTLILQKL